MNADFGAIYDENYNKIFNYVYYRLLNREDTEDVVSDVFFKAMDNIKSFDGIRANVSTWLFRIAANAVNDYYRSKAKIVRLPLEDMEVLAPDRMCDDIIRDDDSRRLRACLISLDDRTRMVIAMRYWGEASYSEIAEHAGLTEKNVSVILSRGMKRLKEDFEETLK